MHGQQVQGQRQAGGAQGQLAKPTKPSSFFDFFDFDSNQAASSSGADAEDDPGVYVTNDKDIAIAFANNNACLPEALVGDSAMASVKATKETSRMLYLKQVVPVWVHSSAMELVLFPGEAPVRSLTATTSWV
ncbi:uncharacterized protein BXZ73DRAFT_102191 [Epithele typhae]|uniref:uncharacterized protein n=1 Tax=Epithele typhae TaxID=378194 RepID=UPI002007B413|nr:uncharacterized protein BXZ73DRAFT_102191 [Epithele typhae]KAH9929038.1 hypothetical protein BXZ73DRAFT_102191 [Epithele typhae]